MSPNFFVRCAEPAVDAAIRRWLQETRLEPPIPLCLEIAVREPSSAELDARPVFRQPTVEIYSGPPESVVRLRWLIAPATAEVSGDTASVVLSARAVERLEDCLRTFLLNVLIFLLRRAGWHHVHAAAAVDPSGAGWVLAGNSAAGKSTTTALLAARGWAIGTDDIGFLAADGDRVALVACRSLIALRNGARALFAETQGRLLAGRDKYGVWPEELGATWAPRIHPTTLLFTTVGDAVTTAVPLGPRETLAELVRWSAWVVLEPHLAQEHLDLLARLGRQARAYRVSLGRDLFQRPDRLREVTA